MKRLRLAAMTLIALVTIVLAPMAAPGIGAALEPSSVTVTGHFLDSAGVPQRHWTVDIEDATTFASIATAITDTDGAFSLTAPAGTYAFTVSHTGNPDAAIVHAGPWNFVTDGVQDLTLPTVVKRLTVKDFRYDTSDTHSNSHPVPDATVSPGDIGSPSGGTGTMVPVASPLPGGNPAVGYEVGVRARTDSTGVARLHLLSTAAATIAIQVVPPAAAALQNGVLDGVGLTTSGPLAIKLGALPTIIPELSNGGIYQPREGTSQMAVELSLSERTTVPVTVHWTTVYVLGAPDGQAVPGVNYVPASGTFTFAPGQDFGGVFVTVTSDPFLTSNAYVVVSFSDPTNARMGGY